MPRLTWDDAGSRIYQTGVDRGVLYPVESTGQYGDGVSWNGITSIDVAPTDTSPSPYFMDNQKYSNNIPPGEFAATLTAITYPEEFEDCQGYDAPIFGTLADRQDHKLFGLSYRTLIGDDTSPSRGYKIHLLYGISAEVSPVSSKSLSATPEEASFSWKLTSIPIVLERYRSLSHFILDSTKLSADIMYALETILYGSDSQPARLPSPNEIISIIRPLLITYAPDPKRYGNTIVIPNPGGIIYLDDLTGEDITGRRINLSLESNDFVPVDAPYQISNYVFIPRVKGLSYFDEATGIDLSGQVLRLIAG